MWKNTLKTPLLRSAVFRPSLLPRSFVRESLLAGARLEGQHNSSMSSAITAGFCMFLLFNIYLCCIIYEKFVDKS